MSDYTSTPPMSTCKRRIIALLSLLLAAAIYLPCMHWLFRPTTTDLVAADGISPTARKLVNRNLRLWNEPRLLAQQIDVMRSTNAEWDFMGRSFLAWSLANVALREPSLSSHSLSAMDHIIDNTLQIERERGMYFFLMPYAQARPWVQQPTRSLFIDGEIALMLAMRCVVQDKPKYRQELQQRVDAMVARMEASSSLSAESYPDECWTFCNVTALAAKPRWAFCGHMHRYFRGDILWPDGRKTTVVCLGRVAGTSGVSMYVLDKAVSTPSG